MVSAEVNTSWTELQGKGNPLTYTLDKFRARKGIFCTVFLCQICMCLHKNFHLCYWPNVRSKWLDIGRSSSQLELRIRFILPARAASHIIKWLAEQDIYRPIIYYSISRSQVSTCYFFQRVKLNHWATAFNTWWSVNGLLNHSFFFKPSMTGSSVTRMKYWENIYSTVDLKFLFYFLCSSLLPAVRGENEEINK